MTDVGEGVGIGVVPGNPDKYLRAEIIEVNFSSSYKTAHSKTLVETPHWPADKFKFNYSKKPAVFLFDNKGSQKADVKVNVDSKGLSGNGKLTGVLKTLQFEGELPLASGEHTVTVTLKEPPDGLEWIKGNTVWTADGGDISDSAGETFLELFFIFEDPAKQAFFRKSGVWAEALRFLFEKSGIRGEKNIKQAAGEVTKCCFNYEYRRYEIKEGGPGFGGMTGVFELEKYMKLEYGDVNCYDQTYAVVVFSGALGLAVDGLYMDPFGFLNKTDLVGRGASNNPFPKTKYDSEIKRLKSSGVGSTKIKPPVLTDYLVVDVNDIDRAAFGNHMFCEMGGKIFDACAGSAKGSDDRAGYVSENVDTRTSLNNYYVGFPGSISNIKPYNDCLIRLGSNRVINVDATVKRVS